MQLSVDRLAKTLPPVLVWLKRPAVRTKAWRAVRKGVARSPGSLLGVAGVLALGALVYTLSPSLRRYLRIERM
jgi:hypothetical protein